MTRRILAATAALVAAAIGGTFVAGALLPAGHVATASATIPAPPNEVWLRITDFDRQETWRSAVEDVRSVDGRTVEERDRWGDVLAFAIAERVEGERLVLEVLGDGPFGGTWTIALAPAEGGTRVEITERGEIRSAPVRVLARLAHDPTATARTWLADLGRSFGAEVAIDARLER